MRAPPSEDAGPDEFARLAKGYVVPDKSTKREDVCALNAEVGVCLVACKYIWGCLYLDCTTSWEPTRRSGVDVIGFASNGRRPRVGDCFVTSPGQGRSAASAHSLRLRTRCSPLGRRHQRWARLQTIFLPRHVRRFRRPAPRITPLPVSLPSSYSRTNPTLSLGQRCQPKRGPQTRATPRGDPTTPNHQATPQLAQPDPRVFGVVITASRPHRAPVDTCAPTDDDDDADGGLAETALDTRVDRVAGARACAPAVDVWARCVECPHSKREPQHGERQ